MTVLVEGDLQMTLPATVTGRKFDDDAHGLSHCMKAVDFIVELEAQVLFIEFKDPENPDALALGGAASVKYIKQFRRGTIDFDLKTKFRDTWLYEYAHGRVVKPITYLVLIGASALSAAELLARTDALKQQIPLSGPNNQPWVKPFLKECAVLNIDAWNRQFPQLPVSRVR